MKESMVRETVKKMMLAGIGLFSITREKAEQVVKELVAKGQVNIDEAKGVVDELVEKGEQEKMALLKIIRKEIRRASEELELVNRQDLKVLEERLSRLEAQTGQGQ